jgi:hypothetical protein
VSTIPKGLVEVGTGTGVGSGKTHGGRMTLEAAKVAIRRLQKKLAAGSLCIL